MSKQLSEVSASPSAPGPKRLRARHFPEGTGISDYVVLERQRATENRRLAVIDSVTGDRLLNIALDD